MILFENAYFQLDYDPTDDVLQVQLPYMDTAELSEAEHCFRILVDYVRHYYVQHLLLDSSHALVKADEQKYNQLIYRVSMRLKHTSLKKVARLSSSSAQLEKMARQVQGEVLQSAPDSYQIKNFTDKAAALAWLTEKAV